MKKIIACSIGQTTTEKSVMLWGYEIPEIEKKESIQMLDPQLSGREFKEITKILKEKSYQVLGYYLGQDITNEIKEKIKEFFKEEKGIVRINSTGRGKEVIQEIKDLVEIQRCKFENERFKSNDFADDQSKAYFNLKKLLKKGLIEIPDIPELESQFDKVEWVVENNKDKIVLPEENQEFVKAMILFTWAGGLAFDFIPISRKG